MKRIVLWLTDNRSELVHLGVASVNLIQVLFTCWGIYMAIRHGSPVTIWDVILAFRDLYGAGVDVAMGITKLYRKHRRNGKGRPHR